MVWAATAALVLVPTAVAALRALLRGQTGVDLIAMLAIAGTLVFAEYLAGAIIAVMLTGGSALERFAAARARQELTALLRRAPQAAHRLVGQEVRDVPIAEVRVGDILLVKPAEVLPVDGILFSARATLDNSTLTGESRPAEALAGDPLSSGTTNAGTALELRATATADASTYAGIVRLVRSAEASKAPVVRLADRYALGFLLVTAALTAGAWLLSGDPRRALAVLVVATPCPLLLAAPSAIMAGMSAAARHAILFKGGAALETLARAEVLLLDKTGTLTTGKPRVAAVETVGSASPDEVLRLAASIEQLSTHPFAPALIGGARDRGYAAVFPTEFHEDPGAGIAGLVDGRPVRLGQLGFAAPGAENLPAVQSIEMRTAVEGLSPVYLAADGKLIGAVLLSDPVRTEAARCLMELRRTGIRRVHLVTGDHPDLADVVGGVVGVDLVHAQCRPEDKVRVVRSVRPEGVTAMVGDGVNDAPALALADVGIAMGARGATAASEAAGVVLTADRLESLVLARRIAQRTRGIAVQAMMAGMGLSLVAMGFAAGGWLAPVEGALLQEAIDVCAIVYALRALSVGRLVRRPPVVVQRLGLHLQAEHRQLRSQLDEVGNLAMQLGELPAEQAGTRLRGVRTFLEGDLLPHEREEQRTAYPLISRMLKVEDPTGPLIHTHHEIERLVRLYSRMLDRLPETPLGAGEIEALRRTLYSLHAVLELHFAQEEELYRMFES